MTMNITYDKRMDAFHEMLKVDWRNRYEELSKLSSQLIGKIRDLGLIQSRIEYYIADTERRRLMYEKKTKLLRIKETVTIYKTYDDCRETNELRVFETGTLIDFVNGNELRVEDGYYQFSSDQYEIVELENKDIDWSKVIG